MKIDDGDTLRITWKRGADVFKVVDMTYDAVRDVVDVTKVKP